MKKSLWMLIALTGFAISATAQNGDTNSESSLNNAIDKRNVLHHIVAEAIDQFEQTPRANWSYKLTRYENEEGDVTSSIEVFDPSRETDSDWFLLQSNGQEPTNKQQEKFQQRKQNRAKEGKESGFRLKLKELVKIDSLILLTEDDTLLKANFDVHLSRFGEKATENLSGTLTYLKDDQFIETIEITNVGEFSPIFSAKISDFKLTLSFSKRDTAILPKQIDMAMKGTFAFFTEIDEVSSDTFSDYRYIRTASSE